MPWYMDRHVGDPEQPFSPEDIIKAHEQDLTIQERFGVKYLTALVDHEKQRVFCLADAPSKEAAEAVHREAHGMMAERIIEVDPDTVSEFFGVLEGIETGELSFGSGLRTILFTDIEGSTALYDKLGDEAAVKIRHEHDEVVREAIHACGGREIKHTGDGIMACFGSVVRAVECSRRIQEAMAERNAVREVPVHVRVGLNAGEPVAEGPDLFGTTVNMAARICAAAEPGAVYVSQAIKELAQGKGLKWLELGPHELKGFEQPINLFRLAPGDQRGSGRSASV